MKNIKNWLEPKKHKVIAGVSAVIVIGLIIAGVYFATKKDVPVVVFKENIVVEYGQKQHDDAEQPVDDTSEKETVEKLATLLPEDIIQKDKSKFDEISFNKLATEGHPMTLEFQFLDTSAVGKHESILYARLGNEVQEFKFSYDVKDTKPPVITGDGEVTLEHDEAFDVKKFKAYDIIDGELEIIVDGLKEETGTFEITLKATDKNNNTTEKIVKVTRKDAPVVEPTTNTENGNNNNSSGNQSSSNSNNAGSTGNNNSNNSSAGASNTGGGNSNGSSGGGHNTSGGTKPTEPAKPSKPSRPDPYQVAKEIGMTFYKDYGNTDGCIAVMDKVKKDYVEEWRSNLCDDNGYMFYTPR